MILQRRIAVAVTAIFLFVLVFHIQSAGVKSWANSSSSQTPHNPQNPGGLQQGQDGFSRIVVIASTSKEDTAWLNEELPDIPKAVYVVDNPSAEFTVPANKGHEAMVYLTYLIDHYDNLPDVMIFLHAHRIAWHNNDLLGSDAAQMIKALSSNYVQRRKYVNMRCHWDPGCPDWMHPFNPSNRTDISKPEERELAAAFKEIFPDRPVPETMATPCCAQFALSREAVHSVTREAIMGYRDWILQTTMADVISGRIWEYLWHYVFSGEPIQCPKMDTCYCDGFGICFGGETQFDAWFELRNSMRKIQGTLKALEDDVKERGGKWASHEQEAKKKFSGEINEILAKLNDQLAKAKDRGSSPQLRAQDSGREWRRGDGF